MLFIGGEDVETTFNYMSTYHPKIKCDYFIITHPTKNKTYQKLYTFIKSHKIRLFINYNYDVSLYEPFHKTPNHIIKKSITQNIVKHIKLTQTFVKFAINKKMKCGFVNISNETISKGSLFGYGDNSIPYLSLYQGSSAYKFMFNEGISKEYKKIIDVLNIQLSPFHNKYLPRKNFLYTPPKKLVHRVASLIGHFKGTHHITVTHSLFSIFIHIHPRLKNKVLNYLSKRISKKEMANLRTSQEG